MTQSPSELVSLAFPYGLNAMTESERVDVEGRLTYADTLVADAFYDEVRAVRETMAALSVATAVEPPAALRDRLLASVANGGAANGAVDDRGDNVRTLRRVTPQRRWRTAVLSAAAVLAVGLGAVGLGNTLRAPVDPSTAEQVFAARDVHTISGAIPAGGTATVVFSRDRNAGVLVMNDVPPPSPGTVYQMWLISDNATTSAGTMDDKSVAPSTTAVLPDLRGAKKLAFTAEPGTGSTRPTGQVIAELPLL
jgi:anti-sigma-K factor RskA